MKLNFPNPCRSFDGDKSRVNFWGYDNAIEVSFFVETDSLKQLCPEMSGTEKGFLDAFDTARNRIHEVADKVYRRTRKGTYAHVLAAKDF